MWVVGKYEGAPIDPCRWFPSDSLRQVFLRGQAYDRHRQPLHMRAVSRCRVKRSRYTRSLNELHDLKYIPCPYFTSACHCRVSSCPSGREKGFSGKQTYGIRAFLTSLGSERICYCPMMLLSRVNDKSSTSRVTSRDFMLAHIDQRMGRQSGSARSTPSQYESPRSCSYRPYARSKPLSCPFRH